MMNCVEKLREHLATIYCKEGIFRKLVSYL